MSINNFSIVSLSERKDLIPICAKWIFNEWGRSIKGRTLEYYFDMFEEYSKTQNIPHVKIGLQNNEAVGMAAIRDYDLAYENSELKPWLTLVYIDKKYRNKGFGSQLVSSIEKYAADIGIKTIYLYTLNQQNMYRRLKWLDFESVYSVNEPEKKSTVMRKIIGLTDEQ